MSGHIKVQPPLKCVRTKLALLFKLWKYFLSFTSLKSDWTNFPETFQSISLWLKPAVPWYTPGEILRRVMSKGPEKGSFGLQLWLHRSPSNWKGIVATSGYPPLPRALPMLCTSKLCYLAPGSPWELAFFRAGVALIVWQCGFLLTPASRSWD